jgi:hypothetical protein
MCVSYLCSVASLSLTLGLVPCVFLCFPPLRFTPHRPGGDVNSTVCCPPGCRSVRGVERQSLRRLSSISDALSERRKPAGRRATWIVKSLGSRARKSRRLDPEPAKRPAGRSVSHLIAISPSRPPQRQCELTRASAHREIGCAHHSSSRIVAAASRVPCAGRGTEEGAHPVPPPRSPYFSPNSDPTLIRCSMRAPLLHRLVILPR